MSVMAIRIRYFQQKGAEFRTCLADEECALLTAIICAIHSRVIPTPTPAIILDLPTYSMKRYDKNDITTKRSKDIATYVAKAVFYR